MAWPERRQNTTAAHEEYKFKYFIARLAELEAQLRREAPPPDPALPEDVEEGLNALAERRVVPHTATWEQPWFEWMKANGPGPDLLAQPVPGPSANDVREWMEQWPS